MNTKLVAEIDAIKADSQALRKDKDNEIRNLKDNSNKLEDLIAALQKAKAELELLLRSKDDQIGNLSRQNKDLQELLKVCTYRLKLLKDSTMDDE
ncbi:uncharacterized protein LOC142354347 [Convolutriloba macropyga]|uniref:uncharacterized protein LOC142354347 n=1 Tax=Convolutriloba macropyga TaxID=536237 RepID=UPI003F528E59